MADREMPLPCPRCGEKDPHIFYGEQGQIAYVGCWACLLRGPQLPNPTGRAMLDIDRAVALWNCWGRMWDEASEVQQ